MNRVNEINRLLEACTDEERKEIFDYLRSKFQIHPIEGKLNVTAEVILEAIDRSPDITQRGIRGIIAEAAFKKYIIDNLKGWVDKTPSGEKSFDFLISDLLGEVTIQVKLQRQKNQKPMLAKEGYNFLSDKMYVVETQKTRGGKDIKTGKETRPYRFGEFDILAVSMFPSVNDWTYFMYTVSDWLLPRSENPDLILKFQPVPKKPNDDWTDNFLECVGWFRQRTKKTIKGSSKDSER